MSKKIRKSREELRVAVTQGKGKLFVDPRDKEEGYEYRWVNIGENNEFRKEDLDRQSQNCIEPLEIRKHIYIYKEPVFGVKYIAGMDCSDEGGEGVNDLVILDKQTGEEVAEIYADIPANKFAEYSYELLSEYNTALVAPERNGTVGGIVIEKFRSMNYPNIYIDDKGREGWYTHSFSPTGKVDRYTMLKEYEEAFRLRQTVVRSIDAIGEMSTFVRDKNGKYKHLSHRRDDRVMARAIAWQMRKQQETYNMEFGSINREATTYA